MKFYIDDILPISFIITFFVLIFVVTDMVITPYYSEIAVYIHISLVVIVLLMVLSYYVHMLNRNKKMEMETENSEYEIEKVLILSTGHISKSEFNTMTEDDEMPFRVIPHEFGIILILYDFDEVTEYEDAKGYMQTHFPKLWRVILFSKNMGCKYINFDQDGIIYPALPNYDW